MVTATTDEYVGFVENERDAALRDLAQERRQRAVERSDGAAERRAAAERHLRALNETRALLGASGRGSEGLKSLLKQAREDAENAERRRAAADASREKAEEVVRAFRRAVKAMSFAVMNGDQIDVERALLELEGVVR